ncbi:protein NRT1/ PTR FAMILY 5.5-like [Corylus avellana]|uniref:protein NRT1/ PTR FAMILY 5.5-like n=1 Tax=Corylus avellana TaxID=13451 RepID=UPI00286CEE8D|nr:protein NRT1/ PTR FAMILY 5.5-like [Corylus avellana]
MSQLVLLSPLMAFLSRLKSYLFVFIQGKVSFWSIVVLGWAGRLAEYALWSRMTYLTELGLDTTHAAAIVNVCTGVETIMPTGMAFLVDAFVSDYRMLLFSSTLAYSLGICILAMSTPTLLSKYVGPMPCDNGPAKCITDARKALFYISIPFIIIGVSGHVASLGCFLKKKEPIETESLKRKFMSFFWKFILCLVPMIITFALSFLPWFGQYGIPAIVLMVVALLFVSVSGSYKYATPQGSPLITIFRVFVASASKMFCPRDAQVLHENRPSSCRLPHTQGLRCLDKAAIVISTQNLEQQEQNRWKLCSVSEVEETKIFIRMIPMWVSFIMCGVISSVGDTYFLDQAGSLDPKIGKVEAPVFTLLIFQKIVELMFSEVTKELVKKGSSKYAAPIGNIVATIFSILCCITAAKVETKRLHKTPSDFNDNDPNEHIPLSMFWLLPQFFLLGAVDGISHNLFSDDDEISGFNIACFFNGKVPDSIISYLKIFSDSVFGIGNLGSAILGSILGPIWLDYTLSESHFDNYYWTLAVLSSINLVVSILVVIWYRYKHSAIEENRMSETQLSTR